MMDTDTFLATLYVLAGDFCKYQLPPEKTLGPKPSLTRGEVVTLALFGQWSCFLGERGFYRYASNHLHHAFRLDREGPHSMTGFQTRLAAKTAWHNFRIWFNLKLGSQPLEFATLLDC